MVGAISESFTENMMVRNALEKPITISEALRRKHAHRESVRTVAERQLTDMLYGQGVAKQTSYGVERALFRGVVVDGCS